MDENETGQDLDELTDEQLLERIETVQQKLDRLRAECTADINRNRRRET